MIFIALILILQSVINAVSFYLLVNRAISLKESFKLTCTATAVNKFLFTGSGYLASSYFSRSKNLLFHKTLSTFLLLEALGVSLWLGLGIYFGVKLAVKIPVIFIPILIFMVILSWLKRQKFTKAVKGILTAFKNMGKRISLIMPFIVLNMILFIGYYFFLFRLFDFYPDILNIVKIISVSFTVGYLSPAPAGLGFRESGLILLLMDNGLAISNAISVAVLDRVIITAFWGILGSVVGFDLIKKEVKKRFKKAGHKS